MDAIALKASLLSVGVWAGDVEATGILTLLFTSDNLLDGVV